MPLQAEQELAPSVASTIVIPKMEAIVVKLAANGAATDAFGDAKNPTTAKFGPVSKLELVEISVTFGPAVELSTVTET